MKSSIHIVCRLLLIAPLAFLMTCANIVKPSGGERDTEGPEIIGAIPAPQTLNYAGTQVDFYFDEFIKPGNYSQDIFISPIPEIQPLITVKNRRLRIEFQEPLRDSTTYVITLGTGIKDFNESNEMAESFTYAFSTGDKLDSMSITGTIENAWSGERQGTMNVFLFPAEDVEGNEIFDLRPVYAVESDESGAFKFEYLRNAAYKIYAVGDLDKSYSYNSEIEMIGLAEDPRIDLTDTNQVGVPVEMFSFFQDQQPPQVKSLRWVNDHTLHLETNEPLRAVFGQDSLKFILSDTLGNNPTELSILRYRYKDKSNIYLHTPSARSISMDLQVINMIDTLGNRDDSLVRIDPENMSREEKDLVFDAPIFQPEKDRILLNGYFQLPTDLDTSHIQLVDTSGNIFEMDLESSGFELRALLPKFPEAGMPFKLMVKPGIEMPGGTATDTTLEFGMIFPSIDDFGSVSGKIMPDSTQPDAVWTVLILGSAKGGGQASTPPPGEDDDDNAKGRGGRGSSKGGGASPSGLSVLQRYVNKDAYNLYRFLAGNYRVKFIRDDDANGYFTPGSLDPYRMPEKTSVDPSAIEIRAKWEVEGYNLFPSINLETPEADSSAKSKRR